MNRLLSITCICLLMLAACSGPRSDRQPVESNIAAEGIQVVEVSFNRGTMRISSDPENQISLTSTVEFKSTTTADTLILDFEGASTSDRAEVFLPEDVELSVTTYLGNIQVGGRFSDLSLRNTAGDSQIEDFQGSAVIWSGRGDVLVQDGGGNMVIFGEHGLLELSRFSGPASVATIMGTIHFEGLEGGTQSINLESDHGPVTAHLPEQSSYQLQITTASGSVSCLGGNMQRISRGCIGSTGSGQGPFTIRTVSGAIEVHILP